MDVCYRMMLPDMIPKTVVPTEGLLTKLARKVFLVSLIVSPRMFDQIFPLWEYLATHFTLVFLASRGLLVSSVALHRHPVPPAPPALEPVLHTVLQVHMALQPSVGGECITTKFTVLQSSLGVLDSLVVLHGLFGSERLLAVAAHEGSLPRVEPHVVDEVEVLSERLAAMITDMFRLGEVVCRVSPHFWPRH